jgi:hypothetical protein
MAQAVKRVGSLTRLRGPAQVLTGAADAWIEAISEAQSGLLYFSEIRAPLSANLELHLNRNSQKPTEQFRRRDFCRKGS